MPDGFARLCGYISIIKNGFPQAGKSRNFTRQVLPLARPRRKNGQRSVVKMLFKLCARTLFGQNLYKYPLPTRQAHKFCEIILIHGDNARPGSATFPPRLFKLGKPVGFLNKVIRKAQLFCKAIRLFLKAFYVHGALDFYFGAGCPLGKAACIVYHAAVRVPFSVTVAQFAAFIRAISFSRRATHSSS